MDAGRGRTQCHAQSARVENVKLCSFYACLGGKKFYSRRASCASAEGRIETGVWRSKKVAMPPNRSPTMACCGSLRIGSLFYALRAILVLSNAVMSPMPTGLSAGSRVFKPLRTARSRSPVIRSGGTLAS